MLGTGLGATVFLGATGGALGGQAGALTEAAIPEAISMLSRGGWDGQHFMQTAQDSGFLDPGSIAIDATSGAISAGFGHALTQLGASAGWLPESPEASPVKTIIGLYPKQGMVFIQMDTRTLQMPMSEAEQIMRALGIGSWETARQILEEIMQTGVEETLEDFVSP